MVLRRAVRSCRWIETVAAVAPNRSATTSGRWITVELIDPHRDFRQERGASRVSDGAQFPNSRGQVRAGLVALLGDPLPCQIAEIFVRHATKTDQPPGGAVCRYGSDTNNLEIGEILHAVDGSAAVVAVTRLASDRA